MSTLDAVEQSYVTKMRVSSRAQTHTELTQDLLGELRDYLSVPQSTSNEVLLQSCRGATRQLMDEWHEKKINPSDPKELLRFYSETQAYCYELTGLDISAPPARKQQLADLLATLESLKKTQGLDFGSGIGSTGIYLLQSGLMCDFADVSATNLGFIQLRLRNRRLEAKTFHLPDAQIPRQQYDFILAMDVLEHVADPIQKISELRTYLKPDGILIFNIIAHDEDEDPLHIMHDGTLIRRRIRGLGFKKFCSIGEFKFYQKVDRPRVLNSGLRCLDTLFWSFRNAVKGT